MGRPQLRRFCLFLELAHRRPDRVHRAVLLDPALWLPPSIALAQAEGLPFGHSYESASAALEAREGFGALAAAAQVAAGADLEAFLDLGDGTGAIAYRYSPQRGGRRLRRALHRASCRAPLRACADRARGRIGCLPSGAASVRTAPWPATGFLVDVGRCHPHADVGRAGHATNDAIVSFPDAR